MTQSNILDKKQRQLPHVLRVAVAVFFLSLPSSGQIAAFFEVARIEIVAENYSITKTPSLSAKGLASLI